MNSTTNSLNDCRVAFEAWAKEVNPIDYIRLLDRQLSGNYTNSTTMLLWTAWQAAYSHYELVIAGLNGVIASQKQTHDALIKKINDQLSALCDHQHDANKILMDELCLKKN